MHSSGKIKFIGKSADEILEDYLQKIGHEPNSKHWYIFARQVIELAQDDSIGSGKVTEAYFKKPKRINRVSSSKRTRKVHRRKWSRKSYE